MVPKIGDKFLVTTDNWFFAPDGQQYKAVFGTVKGIQKDKDTLGIETNRQSTNWYLSIGCMIVAGCQIHYAVKCDDFNSSKHLDQNIHNGMPEVSLHMNRIFNADL